ncbi:MAG: ACP S-malonyltransferase [Pseudomonadales bacterium]
MSLGFVFPGQGSQSVGMLAEMAGRYPIVRATFDEAGDVLDLPLWALVSEGPQERLNQTEITQPVLLTASTALWRVWKAEGGRDPDVLAGHSLGEYSALVCAEALSFADAVALVHQRGKLMQEAVPQGEGAMAAILGLEDDVVAQCCEAVDGVVSPANFNAPSQVVIAGAAAAVAAAVEKCNEAGARRAVPLQVSGPFHCELMAPAKAGFAQALGAITLSMPRIPVVHNVDASVAADLDELRSKLLEQMARPVQWTRCVEAMIGRGVDGFVECGAGKVLAGLIKRIDRTKTVHNIDLPDDFAAAITQGGGR